MPLCYKKKKKKRKDIQCRIIGLKAVKQVSELTQRWRLSSRAKSSVSWRSSTKETWWLIGTRTPKDPTYRGTRSFSAKSSWSPKRRIGARAKGSWGATTEICRNQDKIPKFSKMNTKWQEDTLISYLKLPDKWRHQRKYKGCTVPGNQASKFR